MPTRDDVAENDFTVRNFLPTDLMSGLPLAFGFANPNWNHRGPVQYTLCEASKSETLAALNSFVCSNLHFFVPVDFKLGLAALLAQVFFFFFNNLTAITSERGRNFSF